MKSFNKNNVDFTKEYMFFGETPNVSRFDVQKFPIFKELYLKQLGFFWKPDEIDLSKDSKDFKGLPPNEQHIFIKNLLFQTFLDSVQSRSPQSFMPHVSNPEIESMIELWAMFESLHSFSYSWIVQNVFSNPTEILDGIMLDSEILNRADSVTTYYDDFMEYSALYQVFGDGYHNIKGNGINLSKRELKKKLLLCMASVNVLEGVRFYASFACSFAFAERGLMEGNSKIISFIARDENLHLAFTQNILKKWANGEDDPEMAEIYAENLPYIEQMYHDCVKQETDWADYLFKDGPMLGLTKPILCEYVKHIAGKRMRTLGIKNEYPLKNPITWTDKYLVGSNVQEAPQEVEKNSYVIGGVKHDIKDNMFKELLT
ncbi:MAG: ribonucleotide-diphosphate reductase subunit beta [Ignavibacteriae bacterium]|nr:ribonucleotide-diphosphate reductase subunit beta [Ignavibacteriota bacterium]